MEWGGTDHLASDAQCKFIVTTVTQTTLSPTAQLPSSKRELARVTRRQVKGICTATVIKRVVIDYVSITTTSSCLVTCNPCVYVYMHAYDEKVILWSLVIDHEDDLKLAVLII